MSENTKNKLQSKTIKRLHDDNLRLKAENKALKEQLKSQSLLAEAAGRYRAEHQKALSALSGAREAYEQAVIDAAAWEKRRRHEATRA